MIPQARTNLIYLTCGEASQPTFAAMRILQTLLGATDRSYHLLSNISFHPQVMDQLRQCSPNLQQGWGELDAMIEKSPTAFFDCMGEEAFDMVGRPLDMDSAFFWDRMILYTRKMHFTEALGDYMASRDDLCVHIVGSSSLRDSSAESLVRVAERAGIPVVGYPIGFSSGRMAPSWLNRCDVVVSAYPWTTASLANGQVDLNRLAGVDLPRLSRGKEVPGSPVVLDVTIQSMRRDIVEIYAAIEERQPGRDIFFHTIENDNYRDTLTRYMQAKGHEACRFIDFMGLPDRAEVYSFFPYSLAFLLEDFDLPAERRIVDLGARHRRVDMAVFNGATIISSVNDIAGEAL